MNYTVKLTEDLGNNQERITRTYDIDTVGCLVNVMITIEALPGKKAITADATLSLVWEYGSYFNGMTYTLLRSDTDPSGETRLVHAYQLSDPTGGVLVVTSAYANIKEYNQWKRYYSKLDLAYVDGAKIVGNEIVQFS